MLAKEKLLEHRQAGMPTGLEMLIYKHGTKIKLKIAGNQGIILAAIIRGYYVEYEIAYYDEENRKTAWFNDFEFDVIEQCNSSMSIGFVGGEDMKLNLEEKSK